MTKTSLFLALAAMFFVALTAFASISVSSLNKGFSDMLFADKEGGPEDASLEFNINHFFEFSEEEKSVTEKFEKDLYRALREKTPEEKEEEGMKRLGQTGALFQISMWMVQNDNDLKKTMEIVKKQSSLADQLERLGKIKKKTRSETKLTKSLTDELKKIKLDLYDTVSFKEICFGFGPSDLELGEVYAQNKFTKKQSHFILIDSDPAKTIRGMPFVKKFRSVKTFKDAKIDPYASEGCDYIISSQMADVFAKRLHVKKVIKTTKKVDEKFLQKWFKGGREYQSPKEHYIYKTESISGNYYQIYEDRGKDELKNTQQAVHWTVNGILFGLAILQVIMFVFVMGGNVKVDVATLRSLGMPRRHIVFMFLVAISTLVSLGLFIGSVAASFFIPSFNEVIEWLLARSGNNYRYYIEASLDYVGALKFCATVLGASVLASLLPALLASSASPSLVWRSE